MLASNNNVDPRNRDLAIWKMMRAGVSTKAICAALRINESEIVFQGPSGSARRPMVDGKPDTAEAVAAAPD